MYQGVGIAEQQKVKKQGRDDHIEQLSIQPPTYLYHYMRIMEKGPWFTTVSNKSSAKIGS